MRKTEHERRHQFRHICIIQTAFIGDVILTTPLIETAKTCFSQASIDIVVIPQTEELVVNNPHLRCVITYDKRGVERGMSGFIKMVHILRRRRYDVALIPHRSWRSALLALCAGIPNRLGFSSSSASSLYTHKVTYRTESHETLRNLNLLSPYGCSSGDPTPNIWHTQTDEERAIEFLKTQNVHEGSTLVGMGAGSVWPTKRWVPEGFAQVADRLISEKKETVIFFGGPSDVMLYNRISSMMQQTPVVAAGKLSLKESAALIARCRVFLSNDTGLMHLAAAMNVPVVAIFGATVPAFGFTPRGEGHTIIEKRLPCRPCGVHGTKRCREKTFACMREIRSQEVYEALVPYL